jgi:hypothetical protein
MAHLLTTLLQKLKLRPRPAFPPVVARKPVPTRQDSEAQLLSLQSLNDTQLGEFVTQQSERNIIKLLQTFTSDRVGDPLQYRIVQFVTDESTLKRIARSEFSKKLKRAAERQLRETGSGAAELKARKLTEANLRIETFLKDPKWLEARELLEFAFSPELNAGMTENAPRSVNGGRNAPYATLQTLRSRLQNQIEQYEKTCSEMEEICEELDPARQHSKAALDKLHVRWKALEEKYTFPKTFSALEKYAQLLKTPRPLPAQRAPAPRTDALPSLESSESRASLKANEPLNSEEAARKLQYMRTSVRNDLEKARSEREERNQAERQSRLAAMDKLLLKLQKQSENIANRHAGAQLRDLRGEVAFFKRWKREYPAQLDEAESLLKTLSSKRTEVVEEAQWDTWARTDLATRIQTELEKTISEIEPETDPAVAVKKAAGLGPRLLDYSKEMRELGRLDRAKDQKIWEQFKSLTDRGWAICDKTRSFVLEGLKAALSEHTSKPLNELNAATVTDPQTQPTFKATAFLPELVQPIKELQMLWREIGAQPSEANREVETVGAKLFELYFRQINLHQGKLKRVETGAVQKNRTLLDQMKIACEGKSTLLSRTRVAKDYETQWGKSTLHESVAAEFQVEFAGYQARLNAELDEEAEKHLVVAQGHLAQAQATLEPILAKGDASLPQALKTMSAIEAELATIDKYLIQLAGLKQEVSLTSESTSSVLSRFQEVRTRTQAIVQECRSVITKEIKERGRERNQVILEAEKLALSSDWESTRARLEELRLLWKKVGVLGQSEDALFGLILENVWEFFLCRLENKDRTFAPDQAAKCLKARKDLIYSLDALTRFRNSEVLVLPFSEEERTKTAGKVLEFGLKLNPILAQDPEGGKLKETKRIMGQWSKMGMEDGVNLEAFWKHYLDRVHMLLGVRPE